MGAPGGGTCRTVRAGCAYRDLHEVQFMASGQPKRVTAPSCSVRPDLRRGKARLVVTGGTYRLEARRGPGVRIRLTIEAAPGQQVIPGWAATLARSSDRRPGRDRAAPGFMDRPGTEHAGSFDPCGPPGMAWVSQPHISGPMAGHGSSLLVGWCCPATIHRAVNPRNCGW
jgi:hypothetical protein